MLRNVLIFIILNPRNVYSHLFLSSGSSIRRTSKIIRRSSSATHWWSVRRLAWTLNKGLCHFSRLCTLLGQLHIIIILILCDRSLIKDLTWVWTTVILLVVFLRFSWISHHGSVNGVRIRVVTIWRDLGVNAFLRSLLWGLRRGILNLRLSSASIHRVVQFWIVKHALVVPTDLWLNLYLLIFEHFLGRLKWILLLYQLDCWLQLLMGVLKAFIELLFKLFFHIFCGRRLTQWCRFNVSYRFLLNHSRTTSNWLGSTVLSVHHIAN